MLCVLLYIQSPDGYSFMQSHKLLPLLSVRKTREYLVMIHTTCGFDKQFFVLFKKQLKTKTDLQKHGF